MRRPILMMLDRAPSDQSRTAASRGAHRTDIEGMRGIAVLLVVLYHSGVGWLSAGFIGVDVFFVLSGYLISGLIVNEVRRTGRIDFLQFYARRARRLLPAAAVMIVATLATGFVIFSPLEQKRFALSAAATALYGSNILFALNAGDYFAADLEGNPFLHAWSLSVEEQFYLFWPMLIALASRGKQPVGRLVALIVGVSAASFVACIWLTSASASWAFFGSPARAWEFGLGGLAWLIPASALSGRAVLRTLLGWVGLLVIVSTAVLLSPNSSFPGAVALVPVTATALVLLAGNASDRFGVGRLLNTRVLQYLGQRSYSWYLFHWPVLVCAAAVLDHPSVPVRLACGLLSLGIASAVHFAIENPIRFHPRLLLHPGLSLAGAAALTCATTVVALGANRVAKKAESWSTQRASVGASEDAFRGFGDCAVRNGRTWRRDCGALISQTRPTVVVFGDSHAAQWLPAITPVADANGWQLVSMTMNACPSVDVPVYNPRLGAQHAERCARWRARSMETIAAIRPMAVILANSREHVEGLRRKDNRPRVSAAEWGRGVGRTLAALTSHAPAAEVILIRDTPRLGFDVPTCLSRAAWRMPWLRTECASDRESALDEPVFDAERGAAARFTHTAIVDLTDYFCDDTRCSSEKGGTVIYRDTDHITRTFSSALSQVMRRRLDGLVTPSSD